MGFAIKPGQSFIKGAACQCLDMLHTNPAQMAALAAAIQGAAPNYSNFETILRNNLLNLKYSTTSTPTIDDIVAHLKNRWFGTGTSVAPSYFPGVSVSQIYAKGLLKAIAYSQSATPLAPIDSYWSVGHHGFDMIVVADNPAKPTKVILIIATPTPTTLSYP
jgi:hypothetical protein